MSWSPIVELRLYALVPGKRDVLIDPFDSNLVESQEDVGMIRLVAGLSHDGADEEIVGFFEDKIAPKLSDADASILAVLVTEETENTFRPCRCARANTSSSGLPASTTPRTSTPPRLNAPTSCA